MIAEFKVDGVLHRFRVAWLNRKDSSTKLDVELTDISENPTDRYDGKRIDYYKFKEGLKNNKIKLII
jgi:hypothetical protein